MFLVWRLSYAAAYAGAVVHNQPQGLRNARKTAMGFASLPFFFKDGNFCVLVTGRALSSASGNLRGDKPPHFSRSFFFQERRPLVALDALMSLTWP